MDSVHKCANIFCSILFFPASHCLPTSSRSSSLSPIPKSKMRKYLSGAANSTFIQLRMKRKIRFLDNFVLLDEVKSKRLRNFPTQLRRRCCLMMKHMRCSLQLHTHTHTRGSPPPPHSRQQTSTKCNRILIVVCFISFRRAFDMQRQQNIFLQIHEMLFSV